jgi:hypothetical protein
MPLHCRTIFPSNSTSLLCTPTFSCLCTSAANFLFTLLQHFQALHLLPLCFQSLIASTVFTSCLCAATLTFLQLLSSAPSLSPTSALPHQPSFNFSPLLPHFLLPLHCHTNLPSTSLLCSLTFSYLCTATPTFLQLLSSAPSLSPTPLHICSQLPLPLPSSATLSATSTSCLCVS